MNYFNKKIIVLIALLIFALLLILGKNYISEVTKLPSVKIYLINIAKVAIPLKNLILMRNVDDKIAILKSSGSCVFCDLSQGDLKGNDLKGVDLRYAILSRANLSNTNLNGVILHHANLSGANLSNSNLQDANLSNVNLTGVDLSNANLNGTILSYLNLSGVNLSGVDLRNKDLSGANLEGVDLSNKDLTGVNLNGVDLSNKDLTGTILKDAKKIEISLKKPNNSNWTALNKFNNLNVTRYDLVGDVQYLATKEGFLFESENGESRLVLDLNNDSLFPFNNSGFETGLLGVASQNKLVYVSYTTKDYVSQRAGFDELFSLVVDEYSMNFTKVRNIIKIDGLENLHIAGDLKFDNLGKLYLSVGDSSTSGNYDSMQSQNLNSIRGKILRLDVSKLKLEPEIIAFGIRNPWGVTIDSKDRMFVLQCGQDKVEAVYLLNDLYSGIPANLGWPVFEGSIRLREDPLIFNDVLAPIFETTIRPGCLTGGVYLNHIESFLFVDFYGTIRLLKQKENAEWYLHHEYKQEEFIWGIGLDKKTKKIFIAPNNLELEILVDQVKLNIPS